MKKYASLKERTLVLLVNAVVAFIVFRLFERV